MDNIIDDDEARDLITFEKESDAYYHAFELAMKNVTAWLNIARSATKLGYHGQAYSVTITAYEEIGKAYVSWLAAKEVIPLDDEIVELVYYKHEVKTVISDLISYEDAFLLALHSGIIDSDDILRDISVTSEEEALEQLGIDAIEREDRRRQGMYIDVWEEDSGEFSVTSPDDISEKRALDAILEVERTHEIVSLFLKLYEDYPDLMKALKKSVNERRSETHE